MLTAKLVTSSELAGEFRLLASKSDHIDIAVAYLKLGGLDIVLPGIREVLKMHGRCRFAVGLSNHYITHPTALDKLLNVQESLSDPQTFEIRYSSKGGFHPKMISFSNSVGVGSALVGSSNLTLGGANGGNVEANIELEGESDSPVFMQIAQAFSNKIMQEPLTKLLTRKQYRQYSKDFEKFTARKKGLAFDSSLEQTGSTGKPPEHPDTDEDWNDLVETIELDRAGPTDFTFWKLSPGLSAWQWPEYLKRINPQTREGVVAIGYAEIGNPENLTREEIMDKMRNSDHPKLRKNPQYHASQLVIFTKSVQQYDYFLVYGHGSILGVGKVIDDRPSYHGSSDSKLYGNRHRVLWKYADAREGIPLNVHQKKAFRSPEDTIHQVQRKNIPTEVLSIVSGDSPGEEQDSLVGWILVHSLEKYEDPRIELKENARKSKSFLWHWKLSRPLRKGGPYTILFAYDEQVFAHGIGFVTHRIRKSMHKEANFAFRIINLSIPKNSVPLGELPLGNAAKSHRSMIRLDGKATDAYFSKLSDKRD